MEKQIKGYLLQNKKLVINNFGFFEIIYKPSEIHPILHTLTVPGNYVFFTEDKNVQNNDFAVYLASQEKISEEEANKRIEEWVQEVQKKIELKEDYALTTLGKFFINAMGKIEFTPALDTDISPESFGLEDFTATIPAATAKEVKPEVIPEKGSIKQELPLKEVKNEDNINDDAEEIEDGFETKKSKKRRKPILVLLITLLILVFCSALVIGVTYYFYPQTLQNHCETIYIFIRDKTSTLDNTEKEPKIEEVIIIKDISSPDENVSMIEDQYIQPELGYTEEISGEGEEQPQAIEQAVEEQSRIAEKQPAVKIGNYYVVIGSFKENANAEAFLAKKQSEYSNAVNLGLGKTSQLYMIAIGPYTHEEAQQQIKNGVKGWLLKK